jgi:hypothetical protein
MPDRDQAWEGLTVKRLAPYGLSEGPASLAMVGKGKAVPRLAARMPSPEIAAKVGAVGMDGAQVKRTHRVVRRNALNS